MDAIDALSVDTERNENLKKAKLENGFYNIVDGGKVSTSKRLSVINPATALLLGVVATTWGLKTSIELGSMTLGFLGALVAALAFSGLGINPPARSFEQSRHMNSTS